MRRSAVNPLRTHWKLLVIAFLLPQAQFLGCSLIGLTIGAISDSSQPDGHSYDHTALDSIEAGSFIRLVQRDGTSREGIFAGIKKYSSQRYVREYDSSLLASDYSGLRLNLDQRVIVRTSVKDHVGRFRGIDRGSLLLQDAERSDTCTLPLNAVLAVEAAEGEILVGDTLRQLVLEGRICTMSSVVISADAQSLLIPTETIERIVVLPRKDAALTGLALGATLDALAVGLVYLWGTSCTINPS